MAQNEIIGDRYHLMNLAARGGMGAVFRARDLTSGRLCAVKVITSPHNPDATRRFMREADILKKLRHPNIVRYVDSGSLPDLNRFLVMEWVDGETLHRRLERTLPTFNEALELIRSIVTVLAEIHAAGIVHRDVKPQNLMLPTSSFNPVQLVDFGIARSLDLTIETAHGLLVGTPGFMAPEQIMGGAVPDGRADVFALGCIFFQLITGRRLFEGGDALAISSRVVLEDAPLVRRLRSVLPEAVEKLVASMLARRVEERPFAGPELVSRIDEILHHFGHLEIAPPQLRHPKAAGHTTAGDVASSLGKDRGEDGTLADEDIERTIAECLVATVSVTRRLDGSDHSPLIGRKRELTFLLDECLIPGARIAVTGLAGVGKSHLLRELATRARAQPLPGTAVGAPSHRRVFEINLENAHRTLDVLHALATQLHLPPSDGSDDKRRIASFLRTQPNGTLIILDGADLGLEVVESVISSLLSEEEDTAAAVAIVVGARSAPSGCHTTITLAPLPTTEPSNGEGDASFSGIPSSEAAQLLATHVRAAATSGGETISSSRFDETAISELARSLGGNPQAIRIAAAQVAAMGTERVLSELTHHPPGEQGGAGIVTREIERSLLAAWRAQSLDIRSALCRLAWFAGDISYDEAVIVLKKRSSDGVVDDPHKVVHATLAHGLAMPGQSPNTLAIPASIRQFARAQDPNQASSAEEHAHWLVQYCEPLALAVDTTNDRTAFAALHRRVNDLLQHAERNDLVAARAVRALNPVISGRIQAALHLSLIESAIAAAEQGDSGETPSTTRLVAELIRSRGRVRSMLGHYEEAVADLRQARSMARAAEDVVCEALSLLDLAAAHHMRGEIERAQSYCRQLVALRMQGLQSPHLEARARGNLGALAHDLGKLDVAYAHYIEAISFAETANDERLLGVFLSNLAALDADRHHPAIARSRLLRAVTHLASFGDSRLVAIAVGNLGMVELELGRIDDGRRRLARAAASLADLGDARSEGLARARLCAAEAIAGARRPAELAAARAAKLINDPKGEQVVSAFALFIDLAAGRIDREEAIRRIEEMLSPDGSKLVTTSDDLRAAVRVLQRAMG